MADKVAIFLDVENLSGWLKLDGGETLLQRASELGRVVVRRAYGDFSIQSVSVRQPELNLLGFEFVHVYHPVKGKNSADIQIVVDVMEYLARIPDLEWVVLATGDSDFSPLFRRLRELGKSVVGVGPRSALSEAVKKSCNRFIYIDEALSSDTQISALKITQMREEALDLLERILEKFPDGASLSTLKNEMLEIDSAFEEKNLGFSGFMKFLQSVPELVTLYQVKQIWHAKLLQSTDEAPNILPQENQSKDVVNQPTIEVYKRFLRKKGWRSCESSFLWQSASQLKSHFDESFTRSEQLEYLIEVFGDHRTRGEIRSAIYILYKAGLVIQQATAEDGDPILRVEMPESEKIMSRKVDLAMLQGLFQICKFHNVQFISDLVRPILIDSYTKKEFSALIEKATLS